MHQQRMSLDGHTDSRSLHTPPIFWGNYTGIPGAVGLVLIGTATLEFPYPRFHGRDDAAGDCVPCDA